MAADKSDEPKTGNSTFSSAALLFEWLKADIARVQRAIADLEARADVDPLLDILNRRGFERELKRSLAYLQRYKGEAALLCIDLDAFKDDRCGRQGHVCAEEGDAGVNCSGIRQKRKNNAFDLSGICRLVPIWMRNGCCYVSPRCTEYN